MKLFVSLMFLLLTTLLSDAQTVVRLTATKAYLGLKGFCKLEIDYASGTTMNRPLIIVEGFDPGHILSPEEEFGLTSYTSFTRDLTNSSSLNSLIQGNTYDKIYVNWENGTDYIQRNAYVLEEVIRWVNQQKAASASTQPNVIIGQSMGGIITRYALRDMENNSLVHQVRLFISHDAPHQGANVPQGYQHFARQATGLYVRTGAVAGVTELVQAIRNRTSPYKVGTLADQPAAKQMLYTYVNSSNVVDNSAHNAWQTELKNIGYPQGNGALPITNIAVSNGAECGQLQPFAAGANLLTLVGTANTRFLGDLLAGLPIVAAGGLLKQPGLFLLGAIPGKNSLFVEFRINAQADGSSNQIYKGRISYTKKIVWLIPVTAVLTDKSYSSNAANLAIDHTPGGFYFLDKLNLQDAQYTSTFVKYGITASNQRQFNFVPVTSALDIGANNVSLVKADYLRPYPGSLPPIAPKNSPFPFFITGSATSSTAPNNQQHISFASRNGTWLTNAFNGTYSAPPNCVFSCDNSFYNISGVTPLCTTQAYTINNLPPLTTLTWSISPSGIVSNTQPVVGQINLTKITNGNITLNAVLGSSCATRPSALTKNIPVGNTSSFPSYTTSPSPICSGEDAVLTFAMPGGSTITAAYESSTNNPLTPAGSNSYVLPGNVFGVKLVISNNCGTTTLSKLITKASCFARYSVSPNPATNTIGIEGVNLASMKTTAPSEIKEIQILNKMGLVIKQINFPVGIFSPNINISTLSPDIYTMRIFDGNNWESHQFIKQ